MRECARCIDDNEIRNPPGVLEYLLGPVQKLAPYEAGIERRGTTMSISDQASERAFTPCSSCAGSMSNGSTCRRRSFRWIMTGLDNCNADEVSGYCAMLPTSRPVLHVLLAANVAVTAVLHSWTKDVKLPDGQVTVESRRSQFKLHGRAGEAVIPGSGLNGRELHDRNIDGASWRSAA